MIVRKGIAFVIALLLLCLSVSQVPGVDGASASVWASPAAWASPAVTSMDGEPRGEDDLTEESSDSENGKTAKVSSVFRMQQLGYRGMTLSSSMKSGKRSLKAELRRLSKLRAGKDYAEDNLVIMAKTRSEAEKIASCYGAELEDYGEDIGVIRMNDNDVLEETLELAASEDTDLPPVYPNYYYKLDEVPNDPLYSDTYVKRWQHNVVGSLKSWEKGGDGEGITVAVIDSGVYETHEDLDDNLLEGKSYYESKELAGASDGNGHGTHVCGIVAAEVNNGKGSFGVAPKAKILPIRVMSPAGKILMSDIAKGINYAVSQGADVINMSLGGAYTEVLHTAVANAEKKGIVMVASAGNTGTSDYNYPASFDEVIGVANLGLDSYNVTDYENTAIHLDNGSNYGAWVDIGAPGNRIYSSTIDESEDGPYGPKSGTSMASPVVAGAVACILSAYPELRGDDSENCTERVREILKASMIDKTFYSPETRSKSVRGCVDVGEAVRMVSDVVRPFYENDPTPFHEEEYYAETDKVLAGSGCYMKLYSSFEGAQIYYTVDGAVPTETAGILYSDPGIVLDFSGEHTIRAVAVYEGLHSDVMEFTADFLAKANSLFIETGKNNTISIPVGGSVKLNMRPVPDYAPMPDVVGQFDSPYFHYENGMISCDPNTPANTTVNLTVCSEEDPEVKCVVKVVAKTNMPLKLSLPYGKITMYSSKLATLDEEKFCTKLAILEDVQCSNASALFTVRSSNPGVVEADEDGVLHARSNGTAVVTVTARFAGKAKSIKRKVRVITPVYQVNDVRTITGYSMSDTILLGYGKKLSLIYDFNLKDDAHSIADRPTDPRFTWTSDSPGVCVKKGKTKMRLICQKGVPIGKTITLTAISKECDSIGFTLKVKITNPIQSIKMPRYSHDYYSVWTVGSQRSEASLRETLIVLKADGGYGTASDVSMESTNPNVLMIEDGKVKAISKGTSKLIFTARDGSGKKCSMKITVK